MWPESIHTTRKHEMADYLSPRTFPRFSQTILSVRWWHSGPTWPSIRLGIEYSRSRVCQERIILKWDYKNTLSMIQGLVSISPTTWAMTRQPPCLPISLLHSSVSLIAAMDLGYQHLGRWRLRTLTMRVLQCWLSVVAAAAANLESN